MKTSNIVIFLIVIIVIAGIFGFAIWDMRNETGDLNANNVYCTGFYENIGSAFVKGKYNFGNNLSELNS